MSRMAALAGLAVLPVSQRSWSECQKRQPQPAYTRRDPRTGFEMRLGDPEGMNHGPLRVFTGNAHPTLANAITQKIGISLGDATVGRFPCGEVNVILNESVRDCDVFVIQPTCNGGAGPQEHLVELLIMLDAIRRGAANRVTAIIPLYGYGRQNAKEKSRSPISARLVTDLLQVAGAHRVVTVELHASQIQGFATFPIDNMYALPMLAKEVEKLMRQRGLKAEDIVVVSPDVGGTKRASGMAKMLCSPLAIFSRQRRRPNEKTEVDLVGEVQAEKLCRCSNGTVNPNRTGASSIQKMNFPVTLLALHLFAAEALPATSLLQVTVQLQRGSVGELAPGTLEALEAGALNSTIAGLSQQVAPKVAQNVAQTEPAKVACPGCAHVASEAELDLLTQVEENEEDEMVALASQAKVSLLQTALEHQHGPAKAKDPAHLHASGIEDADEALALLDAVSELGL